MDLLNLFKNADNAESYTAGSTIFTEGSDAKTMYIVIDGEVDIKGGDEVFDTITSGEIFGEMALIDSQPRSASAVAKTDCSLAPVDEKQFLYMVQETPFFSLHVMRVIAERLRHMNQMAES